MKRTLGSLAVALVLFLVFSPSVLRAECGQCWGTDGFGVRYYYDCTTGEVCYTCPNYNPACAPPSGGGTTGGGGSGTSTGSTTWNVTMSGNDFSADGYQRCIITLKVTNAVTGNPIPNVTLAVELPDYTYRSSGPPKTDNNGITRMSWGSIVPGLKTVRAVSVDVLFGSGSGYCQVQANAPAASHSLTTSGPPSSGPYYCTLTQNTGFNWSYSFSTGYACPGYLVSANGGGFSSFTYASVRSLSSGSGSQNVTGCQFPASTTNSITALLSGQYTYGGSPAYRILTSAGSRWFTVIR